MVIINVEADKSDTKAICDGSEISVCLFFQFNLVITILVANCARQAL